MREVMITLEARATKYVIMQVTEEEHAELVRVVTQGSQSEQAAKAYELSDNTGDDWDVDDDSATLDMRDA